ncbi:MAG: MBL fold metallo-hydrolase [Chloroflexi bacterium]|nr:MBL fold metallo-hydrolase [Chloroflexota bacterium]
MKLGQTELRFVSDGHFRLDGGMMFGIVPRVLWEKRFPPDEENRVGLELNCLLIRHGHELTLVDTGLGTNLPPRQLETVWGLTPGPRLLDKLAAIGLAPEDITCVVNTHLHIDHCGGDTIEAAGRLQPTFPRARYLVQRQEWLDCNSPNERTRGSYFPELLQPLVEGGQMELHLGDVAPFAVHFEKLAWVPGMDLAQLDSLESKRGLLQEVMANDYLLTFYHEDALAAARLLQEGDGYRLVPVPFE